MSHAITFDIKKLFISAFTDPGAVEEQLAQFEQALHQGEPEHDAAAAAGNPQPGVLSTGFVGKSRVENRANNTCCGRVCKWIGGCLFFALFIIACVGAANVLPGSITGWVIAGLGGAVFLTLLAPGKLKDRKWTLIIGGLLSFIPAILGILGGIGVLSAVQVGWGTIGAVLFISGTGLLIQCCLGCHEGFTKSPEIMQRLQGKQVIIKV